MRPKALYFLQTTVLSYREVISMFCSTEKILYEFENTTGLEDIAVKRFTQKVLKCVFDAITRGYKCDSFKGSIQIAMSPDKEFEPFFNYEFVKNPAALDGKALVGETLEVSFYVMSVLGEFENGPTALNGKIVFSINYREEDKFLYEGERAKAVCKLVSKNLEEFVLEDDCLSGFEEIRKENE